MNKWLARYDRIEIEEVTGRPLDGGCFVVKTPRRTVGAYLVRGERSGLYDTAEEACAALRAIIRDRDVRAHRALQGRLLADVIKLAAAMDEHDVTQITLPTDETPEGYVPH